MKISAIDIDIINDSRGNETLEVKMESGHSWGVSSVPSGKSRSSIEVHVKDPKEAKGIFEKELKKHLLDKTFLYQKDFDDFLIRFDSTSDKSNLGGNLILALSLAFARLKAHFEKIEVYEYINKLYRGNMHVIPPSIPRLIVNVINGGMHVKKPSFDLGFQEFQVIPHHESVKDSVKAVNELYNGLHENVSRLFGKDNVQVGDEAGISAPFLSNEQALSILKEETRGFAFNKKHSFDLGVDVAANFFYKKQGNFYRIGDEALNSSELLDYYDHLIHKYGLIYMEDPFYEEAFHDFALINKRKGIYIVGDDLTSTNLKRVRMAVSNDSIDAIVIKPNQIGTLSEVIEVAEFAHRSGVQLVVSHRSGETLDDFVADLAVGLNAWGIKAGCPKSRERLVKYHRLEEIEKNINK